ncbi:hypothetical protein AA14337_3104 [Acetobacter malorum DSM 14337]|uniref:Transposase n=1 Tax=Acetobacter malorum DSM 14337 TaxID=1307910 RepID=A0ABQ0PZN1_9PROT|nr:hypothetical protein AA14337_3104 [Acetobacter malorum DSM 14337]
MIWQTKEKVFHHRRTGGLEMLLQRLKALTYHHRRIGGLERKGQFPEKARRYAEENLPTA